MLGANVLAKLAGFAAVVLVTRTVIGRSEAIGSKRRAAPLSRPARCGGSGAGGQSRVPKPVPVGERGSAARGGLAVERWRQRRRCLFPLAVCGGATCGRKAGGAHLQPHPSALARDGVVEAGRSAVQDAPAGRCRGRVTDMARRGGVARAFRTRRSRPSR